MATLALMKESLRGTRGQIHPAGICGTHQTVCLSPEIRLWESLRFWHRETGELLCESEERSSLTFLTLPLAQMQSVSGGSHPGKATRLRVN